ncbi:hypothetical protein FYK55_12975 [Roseiconus nitratireducens]|uniref:Uncharacterized protein n=1 Tax=Roseiconus nitratireducens TaxID=2605748 RepID=A0A5M6D6K8_9BACT|nr:hypothetical protein [Roseiconus nitratireducens]KAA5543187.1 hypothetical protein FYK55_12975 [Roseiconus nitratireducens]
MKPRQNILAIFAAATLLLGNAAGWVHVAQHRHHGCSHPTACDLGSASPHHVQSSTGHSAEHCDCHESPLRKHWQHPAAAETACQSHHPDGNPAPADGHHGDDCAICHHLFTSRHGLVGLPRPIVVAIAAPTQSVRPDHDVVAFEFVTSANLLRGPPAV